MGAANYDIDNADNLLMAVASQQMITESWEVKGDVPWIYLLLESQRKHHIYIHAIKCEHECNMIRQYDLAATA